MLTLLTLGALAFATGADWVEGPPPAKKAAPTWNPDWVEAVGGLADARPATPVLMAPVELPWVAGSAVVPEALPTSSLVSEGRVASWTAPTSAVAPTIAGASPAPSPRPAPDLVPTSISARPVGPPLGSGHGNGPPKQGAPPASGRRK